jgi:hypothetical protein
MADKPGPEHVPKMRAAAGLVNDATAAAGSAVNRPFRGHMQWT